MAAEFEEPVVDSDAFDAEYLAEQLHKRSLVGRPRGAVRVRA